MRTVDTTMHRGRRERPRRLADLAIAMHRQMRLTYRSPESRKVKRHVSPYEVRGDLLIGWDHDRWDFRTFRLDRIEESAVVDAPAFDAAEEV